MSVQLYKCETCQYSTIIKVNMEKHIKSKKHINLYESEQINIENATNKIVNEVMFNLLTKIVSENEALVKMNESLTTLLKEVSLANMKYANIPLSEK